MEYESHLFDCSLILSGVISLPVSNYVEIPVVSVKLGIM